MRGLPCIAQQAKPGVSRTAIHQASIRGAEGLSAWPTPPARAIHAGTSSSKDYYLVRNSWGDSWGEEGELADCCCCCCGCFWSWWCCVWRRLSLRTLLCGGDWWARGGGMVEWWVHLVLVSVKHGRLCSQPRVTVPAQVGGLWALRAAAATASAAREVLAPSTSYSSSPSPPPPPPPPHPHPHPHPHPSSPPLPSPRRFVSRLHPHCSLRRHVGRREVLHGQDARRWHRLQGRPLHHPGVRPVRHPERQLVRAGRRHSQQVSK
jgi:hypothetical protein